MPEAIISAESTEAPTVRSGRFTYGNGHVYAQHNNTGGAWINNLQAGQTFTMNGSTYRVNGQSVQGAQYAPDSGDWMQTCNGNGNHLVGITKIS